NRAVAENIPITSLPGPVALITALTSTGFPMDKFTFLGFLPIKKGRQTLFQALIDEKRTVVFYESPHRIVRTLSQLRDALGPTRRAAICRELTKMHEEVRRGTLTELAEHFNKTAPRGEFTVVLAPTGF
ncbi:MAG: SAM-dependent methyltransferase, partial [Patescibacteria group bacterium]